MWLLDDILVPEEIHANGFHSCMSPACVSSLQPLSSQCITKRVLLCRFVEHMQRTHPMFADVFYGVFGTEAEAEAYATYGDKRLWALVTFHEVKPCSLGQICLGHCA